MAEFTVMTERKNLVTCKPTEFLKQTNRIRKSAERWMKNIGISDIRSRRIEGMEAITPQMDAKEVAEVRLRNAKRVSDQSKKNMHDIIEAALEKYPEDTLELLALACFVEPEDVDNHRVSFYLANLADILSDRDVISFFTSLVQLEQTGILKA